MRRLVSAVAMAGLALVLAASAQAQGKTRVLVERFSGTYELAIPCADFGPYDFDNVVSGRQHVSVTEIVAPDGTLLQLVVQFEFMETNTHSASGVALKLHGAVRELWDFTTETRTLSGQVFLGTRPGGGVWVQDTGRIELTFDREVLFVAGPHEAFFSGGIDPVVCAALAAG